MKKSISSVALLAILVIAAAIAQAQTTAKVNGKWIMSVESSIGNGTPEFNLKHVAETKLEGTYKGLLGESPAKGTLTGNKIHLEFEVSGMTVEYDGTVEGDTMKGKVKLGTMGDGTFTGAKAK